MPSAINNKNPTEFGEIAFSIHVPPVSQQASSASKQKLVAAVRKVTAPIEYILNGEVKIEVQWLIQERLRWETDASPDLDNILKPLIDGLCGANGILIDDCQVQSISAWWVDWTSEDQQLDITISFNRNEFLAKAGLSFVRLDGPLCFPVPPGMPEKVLQTWLDAAERAIQFRDKITTITNDCSGTQNILPTGFIHRSRIKGFPVHELMNLRRGRPS